MVAMSAVPSYQTNNPCFPDDAGELAERLNRPLDIGPKTAPNRLSLAPLSKIGHKAFRGLVRRHGGHGLLFSGMCSAASVSAGDDTCENFRHDGHEAKELVCQLLGGDPGLMAAAAGRVEAAGFFGVDINFGCSIKAVCRCNSGAALLKTPALAGAIVKAVRRSVDCPLFVKFRTGWSDDAGAAVDYARRFEDAGADALTFHPRVAPDRRSRRPKWGYIAKVKAAVSVPVFGNGDVFGGDDCLKMLRDTGCDGVALGRLAIARPWIFSQWTTSRPAPAGIYRETALEMVKRLAAIYPPKTALRRFNRFAAYYSANFQFGHTLYSHICGAVTLEEARAVLERFFDTSPTVVNRPRFAALGR